MWFNSNNTELKYNFMILAMTYTPVHISIIKDRTGNYANLFY